MRLSLKLMTALVAAALPISAGAATLGGYHYDEKYNYREFFWIADGNKFQVILEGNPFPSMSYDTVAAALLPEMQSAKPPPALTYNPVPSKSYDAVAAALLPQMQSAKPEPALTFNYEKPAKLPRPYYRLYLIADPANDLNAYSVCATGQVRHRPGQPGVVHLFAIYCRNEIALSQTTAWTNASSPSDPAMNQLFRELFSSVIFSKPHS